MMPTDLIVPLASFCLVSTITPGPNNMMLLSSGATFGLRRTLPHMLGISGGCALMVLVLGSTLAAVVDRVPGLFAALHVVSTLYLLWLAWRIATSSSVHGASRRPHPFSALDAAGFQWVNPKAWAMVLGAITSFSRPNHLLIDVPVIALTMMIVGLPCIGLWAAFGQLLSGFLADQRTLRTFNIGMAALLVASILPGIWQALSGGD